MPEPLDAEEITGAYADSSASRHCACSAAMIGAAAIAGQPGKGETNRVRR